MDEDYDIVVATEGDKERIADFLRQHFYPYEPLNMCAGVPPNRPTETMRGVRSLSEGTSLITITKSGLIIGVALNEEFTPEENPDDATSCYENEAYKKVFEFVVKFERAVDVFKLTGTDRGLFIHMLGVNPIAGGRGIGKAMMMKSREIAKAKGYPLLAVMCSSHYTARIAKNMGMECVYRLKFSDYKNEKGEQVFIPPSPHTESALYIQKL